MEAVVTLKLSPAEFNLIVRALSESQEAARQKTADHSNGASIRNFARQDEARFAALHQKLR